MTTMDTSDTTSQGVMIAFLPSNAEDWIRQDLPHMTLVYAGDKADLSTSDFSSLAKDAAMLAMFARPFSLVAKGTAVFGDDPERVKVLQLRPTIELMAMRKMVEHWNKSEHDFNPHITIGPVDARIQVGDGQDVPAYDTPGSYVPRMVYFNRLVVGWGEEYMSFWLNGNNNY